MSRSVPEWIGRTDDAKIPTRVRLRVFEREGGRCHISGRKIMPGDHWDLDHGVALINGGEHRESNLFPALRDKHREKTKADVAEKSRSARIRAKHIGIRAPPQWPKKPKADRPKQGSATRPLRSDFEGDIRARGPSPSSQEINR